MEPAIRNSIKIILLFEILVITIHFPTNPRRGGIPPRDSINRISIHEFLYAINVVVENSWFCLRLLDARKVNNSRFEIK